MNFSVWRGAVYVYLCRINPWRNLQSIECSLILSCLLSVTKEEEGIGSLNRNLSSHFAKIIVVVVTAFWTSPFTSIHSKSPVEITTIYSSLLSKKVCRFCLTQLIFLGQKFLNYQSISELWYIWFVSWTKGILIIKYCSTWNKIQYLYQSCLHSHISLIFCIPQFSGNVSSLNVN